MSLPKPYYDDGNGIVIYNSDCRLILPHLEPVDLVLTDPPYGMNWNTDTTRFSGGHNPEHRGSGVLRTRVVGDDAPFDPTPFLEYGRVILWGFHHYASRLPVGSVLASLDFSRPAIPAAEAGSTNTPSLAARSA